MNYSKELWKFTCCQYMTTKQIKNFLQTLFLSLNASVCVCVCVNVCISIPDADKCQGRKGVVAVVLLFCPLPAHTHTVTALR